MDENWYLHPDSEPNPPAWVRHTQLRTYVGITDNPLAKTHAIRPGQTLYTSHGSFGFAWCDYRLVLRFLIHEDLPVNAFETKWGPYNFGCRTCQASIGSDREDGVMGLVSERLWDAYFGDDQR